MTDPMIRAAAAASLLTLACTSGDVAQVDTTTTTGPPPAQSESESGTDPQGSGPEPPEDGGAPCQVDADCSAGAFCELRICVAGCDDAAGCDAGQVCDPHGREPVRQRRGRVLMVQPQAHGVVQVAFASGDVITLMNRTAVGFIEPPKVRPHRRAS